MPPPTERDAIRSFLDSFADRERLERKSRRVEIVVICLYAAAISVNVTLPAIAAFQWYDAVSYALAALVALMLRNWVLSGIARRRDWQDWQILAAHARARLASLDERPDEVPPIIAERLSS